MLTSKRFLRTFQILIVMVVGLMALGAGVRAMNAGLACPDWPLCFGKVIPDFHVGVYFEFIHRAYAGFVALLFFGCLFILWRSSRVPKSVKMFGAFALLVLLAQIVMGGLTVLKLLKVSIVTSHLMLATTFAATLAWVANRLNPDSVRLPSVSLPNWFKIFSFAFPFVVFAQIWLGGLVASSYAGVVCVDFPLCNGQWVPTLSGAIGLQVMHRFGAYTVAALALALFVGVHVNRAKPWVTGQILALSRMLVSVVLVQVGVGIANLLLFIPPWMTVLHQSMAILILLTALRLAYVSRRISHMVPASEAKQGSVPANAYVAG